MSEQECRGREILDLVAATQVSASMADDLIRAHGYANALDLIERARARVRQIQEEEVRRGMGGEISDVDARTRSHVNGSEDDRQVHDPGASRCTATILVTPLDTRSEELVAVRCYFDAEHSGNHQGHHYRCGEVEFWGTSPEYESRQIGPKKSE